MAIALAALDASNIPTETESDFADELTESSENLFLRNLSQLIANSEQTAVNENQLMITEVHSGPQPQFGYFLPITLTPKLRQKRLIFYFCGWKTYFPRKTWGKICSNFCDSITVFPT